jgi:hypothetical protein
MYLKWPKAGRVTHGGLPINLAPGSRNIHKPELVPLPSDDRYATVTRGKL